MLIGQLLFMKRAARLPPTDYNDRIAIARS
jgi:hypothetical protein